MSTPSRSLAASIVGLLACLALAVGVLPTRSVAATATEEASRAPLQYGSGTLTFLKGWSSDIGLGGWRYQIWTMQPDGSGQRQVTADPDLYPYSAATNPAGNLIAFTVGRDSRLSAAGLYVVAPDGSGRRNVLAGRSQLTEARNPTWSPDGRRLAFVGYDRSITKDIWVVGLDGSGLRRVTRCDCAFGATPQWSPTDANTIAWTPAPQGSPVGLALLDVRTGASTTLVDSTASGAITVSDHGWSPTGGQLAVTGGPWNDTTPNLYVVHVAADDHTPLLKAAPDYAIHGPRWSPQGTWIAVSAVAVSTADDTGQDIWMTDPQLGWVTSEPVSGPYDEEVTSWTPECATACRPGGRWSSLTVSQRQEVDQLRVTGGLMPGRPGAAIVVRVLRQRGAAGWATVRTARTTVSELSTYDVSVPRAAYGTCRVQVSWAGDQRARAASARTGSIIC